MMVIQLYIIITEIKLTKNINNVLNQNVNVTKRSDQRKTNVFLAKFALKITTKLAIFNNCFLVKFALKTPPKFLRNRPIFPRICP